MKIGLFGGSFDPIHFGHLNLAIEMKEKNILDEVWFCPAKINPFKLENSPSVNGLARWEMLRLLFEEIPFFRVLDIEVNREGPSYTVETLEFLVKKYLKHHFYLILGDDAVEHFFKWHRTDKIIKYAKLLIGTRSIQNHLLIQGNASIRSAIQESLVETKIFEVSSTDVRSRLKERKYCAHLVPSKVLDYIYQHDLYL